MNTGDQTGHQCRGDCESRIHLLATVSSFHLHRDRFGAVADRGGDNDGPSGDKEDKGQGHESGGMLKKCFHICVEIGGRVEDWLRIFCGIMRPYCSDFLSEAGFGPTKRTVWLISISPGCPMTLTVMSQGPL